MAKSKSQSTSVFLKKEHKKRAGVHSKCKSSNIKSSVNYRKKYRGQGR
jgi:hypothetical protein